MIATKAEIIAALDDFEAKLAAVVAAEAVLRALVADQPMVAFGLLNRMDHIRGHIAPTADAIAATRANIAAI